ncbi:MAG: hypothetical protein Q7T20_10235, partial [Saprospiraceae bacterium]|nr:hypothetical protein [Saprospiraceae bacterium]
SLGKENIGLSASYFANSFSYSESKIESVYPNYSKRDQHSKVKSSGVFLGPYFGSASGGKKRIYVEASAGFGFVSENQEGKNIQSVTGYIDREDEHLMTTAYLFRGQIRYSFARLGLSAGIGTDFIYFADYENDNAGVVTSNFFGLIMLPF